MIWISKLTDAEFQTRLPLCQGPLLNFRSGTPWRSNSSCTVWCYQVEMTLQLPLQIIWEESSSKIRRSLVSCRQLKCSSRTWTSSTEKSSEKAPLLWVPIAMLNRSFIYFKIPRGCLCIPIQPLPRRSLCLLRLHIKMSWSNKSCQPNSFRPP